jgi:hypothetical protein
MQEQDPEQDYVKYTKKIINFLNNNKQYISNKTYNNKYIDYLTDVYRNIKNGKIDLDIVDSDKIKSSNTKNNYPSMYTMFKELKIKNVNTSSYENFLKWFREDFKKMDLRSILSDNTKYYDDFFNVSKTEKKLHELLFDNSFIPLDIMYYAEIYDLEYEEFKNKNTNIYVYSNGFSKPDMNFIMNIITFFRTFTKKDMDVTLVIFYCNQKKYFPNEKLITSENINSGCTVRGKYVYVWRKEEFYKVLIHELVHYFSIDYNSQEPDALEKSLHKLIDIEGDDVVNEAYTEIFAVTINSVIRSVDYNIAFSTIINYENAFTHFQIAKIINLFDGQSYDDLYNITIKQNTSLVSYIIVKGILLNNYENIIDNLDISSRRYSDYKNIYEKLMNKKSLNDQEINYFLNMLKNQNNDFITKTLRMTVFG